MNNRCGSGDFNRRVPVPSSKKFTPTPIKKEVMQKLLKDDLENSSKTRKMQKAKSVAEITPTKSKNHNRQKCTTNAPIGLHATPRPLIFEETPSGRTRRCNSDEELKLKASWLIYRRMLLYTWRRTRERLIMLHESFRRRQELVSQLEVQVDTLKILRKSETEKCENIIKEMNSLKIKFEFLLNDHKSLTETNLMLKQELDLNRQRHSTDTENQKNEILTKTTKIEQLENDIEQNLQLLEASNRKETFLNDKLKTQHSIIKTQRDTIKSLENELKSAEYRKNQLLEEQEDYRQKQAELSSKYETLIVDSKQFENQLDLLNRNIDDLINENIQLRTNLEVYENCKVWIFARDFYQGYVKKLFLLDFYKKCLYLMLPAMPPF